MQSVEDSYVSASIKRQNFFVLKLMNKSTSCYDNLSAVHIDVYLRQPRTSSTIYYLYRYIQLENVYELGQL